MKQPPPLPDLPAIDIGGFNLDIAYYLNKEYLDIGLAALELPALIETLNWQNQSNVEQLMRCKSVLGRVEAQRYFDLKQGGFEEEGFGEKATDKAVEMAIRLDPKVADLEDNVAILTAWTERLRNLMRSLQFKLDLVRSTEATRRKLPEG